MAGLPRGGVPVAAEVADALDAPLDVIVVRKLGVPSQPELAVGAIGEGGVRIINREVAGAARISDGQLAEVERLARAELERRARRFRGDRGRPSLSGRTAIVVDDGMATGSTAYAACEVARSLGATRVVLAVPVASTTSVTELRRTADEIVCLEVPQNLHAVGQWYADFGQTTDEEVVALLGAAAVRHERATAASGDAAAVRLVVDREVEVFAGRARLAGRLRVPEAAKGIVIFVHGSCTRC